MAKLKVFTVYDCKVQAYMTPFMCRTHGEAIRAFSDEVNNPQSRISKHPEDFDLFYIADYDEEAGQYNNQTSPTHLGKALELHDGKKAYTGAQT